MTARWDWPHCDCQWDRYLHTCFKPFHVAIALRDVPSPRIPLAMSSPVGDYIPEWMTA